MTLEACPHAGNGVHSWLFRRALALHHTTPAPRIVELLMEESARCGRRVPMREIQDAVANAARIFKPRSTGYVGPTTQARDVTQLRNPTFQPQPQWPKPDQAKIECIAQSGPGLYELWETSPIRFTDVADDQSHVESVIDLLFSGNPLLCVGYSSRSFCTLRREEWRGRLDNKALIVPNPMTKPVGRTQDGRESAHCLDNTGSRRFLVTEFDQGSLDQQSSVIWHLRQWAPLTMGVFSGNKSLHAWWWCQGQSEELLQRFMRLAVSLGADHATWNRSQFCRLPDGKRPDPENPKCPKRQTVFYLDPSTVL